MPTFLKTFLLFVNHLDRTDTSEEFMLSLLAVYLIGPFHAGVTAENAPPHPTPTENAPGHNPLRE